MRRWARPTRPLAPFGASLTILAIWWLVAHNGGAGWVQLLGDLVFGVLVIGLFAPFVVLQLARVTLVGSPADAMAGVPLVLRVEASTRLRVRMSEPQELEVLLGPTSRGRHGTDVISLVPARRGVYETLSLDIASAAPFALQWWRRRVDLVLPVALHVAPRCGRPVPFDDSSRDDARERHNRLRLDTGQFRGAVPYSPGDNRRLVHWPATAHVGRLMVRELERPTAGAVFVTVVLPADDEEAERIAEHALGTVVRLLEAGAPVLLDTLEARGPASGPVADRRAAGRRLARAVAGIAGTAGPAGPAGSPSAIPGVGVTA